MPIQHTPTPWTQGDLGQRQNDCFVYDHAGQVLADCAWRAKEAETNAAFIVRACNAHEDAVAMAKSFVEWHNQLLSVRAPKDLLPGLEARRAEVDAFLAKAEGK